MPESCPETRAARSDRCCCARGARARRRSDGAVCGRKAVETGREPLHVPAASHALAACSAAADGEDVRASRCGSRVHVD